MKRLSIAILITLMASIDGFCQCNINSGIFIERSDTFFAENSFTKWNSVHKTIMIQKLSNQKDNRRIIYRIYFIVQDDNFHNGLNSNENLEIKLELNSKLELTLSEAHYIQAPFGMKNRIAFYSELSKSQLEIIAKVAVKKMKIPDLNYNRTWHCRKKQKLIARCLLE